MSTPASIFKQSQLIQLDSIATMTEAMDASVGAPKTKVLMTNPKLRTHLHEYGRRNRTDGPYADNLEVDALVVGGGFAGVFMFWSLRNLGLKTVMYEAGTDLGGTWRWNCYRQSIALSSKLF